MVAVTRRIPFFTVRQSVETEAPRRREGDPTAAYLAPLMALLAIILVTGVFSSGFDWFYPVRVLGTAAVIWFFWRNRLTRLYLVGIWSGGAIAIGAVVFVVWLGLEKALISPRFTWLSFLLSSFLFGALHGRWLAGTVAGMFYAWAMYRRGKVSDAIMAHATTNALIAADVLLFGNWNLWQ